MDDRGTAGKGRTARWLAAGALGLTFASLLVSLAADPGGASWADVLRPWLDVDRNGRVPVAYECACLLLAAAGAWRAGGPGRPSRAWGALAVLLALAGVEKAVGIHEIVANIVALRFGSLRGGLVGSYLLPATAGLVLAAFLVRSLWPALDPALRRRLVLSAVLIVGCGLGLEVAQAAWIRLVSDTGVALTLLAHGEEGGEMLGAALLAGALLPSRPTGGWPGPGRPGRPP